MKRIVLILCMLFLFQSSAYAKDMSDWAVKEYESASNYGLLSYNVIKNNLTEDITREEFCELIINVYRELVEERIKTPEIFPFEDSDSIAVAQAYELGIVSGKGEGIFKPEDGITREEMAKMLVNAMKAALIDVTILKDEADELMGEFDDSNDVSSWAYAEMSVALKNEIISGISKNQLAPKMGASREQAIAIVSRIHNKHAYNKSKQIIPKVFLEEEALSPLEEYEINLSRISGAKEYLVMLKDCDGERVLSSGSKINTVNIDLSGLEAGGEYYLTVGVLYNSGIQAFSMPQKIEIKGEAKKPIEEDESSDEDEPPKADENEPTDEPEENDNGQSFDDVPLMSEKEMRVFPDGHKYQTKEEADMNMTEITIDVWSLDGSGEKVSRKKTLTVNKYLADDIVKIFEEIYNDPSQFPIKDIGCYSWRETAFGSVSEHSYGTCIDINANENYYCYSDTKEAIVGSHWLPEEDVYSITPDGIVVNSFKKYDWEWGGNWTGSVNDYMHFTYLGR